MASDENRLFFAVNFETSLQERIYCELIADIPSNGFSKTKQQNIHITLVFLGNQQKEKIRKLFEQTQELSELESFDAELNSIGHFNSQVLWLGVEKGSSDFEHLARTLCDTIGVSNTRFHAHATLARTKGATPAKVQNVVEILRKKKFSEKIHVRGFDLMQSTLTRSGPLYKKLLSIEFEKLHESDIGL